MDALVKANLNRELARQLNNMQLATQLTTIAIEEVGNLHQDAAAKVADTLKEAKQKIDAAVTGGAMTSQKEQRVKDFTRVYLMDMLAITHHGSVQITHLLMDCSQRR